MNIQRLTKLAEWLEGGAKHERIEFDMSKGVMVRTPEDYDPTDPAHSVCSTVCCLAGAAVQFFAEPEEKSEINSEAMTEDDGEAVWDHVWPVAQEALGLTEDQAHLLFEPSRYQPDREGGVIFHYRGNLSLFNDPAWAARTIRHLIETGEVDWDATEQA